MRQEKMRVGQGWKGESLRLEEIGWLIVKKILVYFMGKSIEHSVPLSIGVNVYQACLKNKKRKKKLLGDMHRLFCVVLWTATLRAEGKMVDMAQARTKLVGNTAPIYPSFSQEEAGKTALWVCDKGKNLEEYRSGIEER